MTDDIKQRLSADPIYWIDKQVALETALADGEIADANKIWAAAEIAQAKAKVKDFLASGKITQAEVDAEVALQKGA